MPPTTPLEDCYGRSPKKNIALAAWHAPLGGCPEEADLCRGQGFRRIAPSAPPRFEDRHVQGPAGSKGQEGILITTRKAAPPIAGDGRAGGIRKINFVHEFTRTGEIDAFLWRAEQRFA